MTRSKRIWLLVGILIIATFFRLYHFTSTPPGLYPDEAADGNNAVEVAETGHFAPFYIEDNGREGLYINILAVMFKTWPVYEPWMVRLPAAIAGILTVLGLYLLVTELFGARAGLLASFFLATSFWNINFSRIGFRAILAPLLLSFALWLFIRAIKASQAKRAIPYVILAGIIYSLGFYTYIAYRITPLLFLLFIPYFRKFPGFWKTTATFVAVIFCIAAPIGLYFVQHPADFFGRTSQIAVTNSSNPITHFALNFAKTMLMFNVHGDDNWRHNFSGAPELFWPVGILFLIGIVWSVASFIKKRKKNPWLSFSLLLLFSWFILAALPAAASDEGLPHALRAILMAPPVMIFAALGAIWAYEEIRKHADPKSKLVKPAAIAFLAVVAIYAYVDYFILWAGNPNVQGSFNADYVMLGDTIRSLPASMPKYIIVNAGGVIDRGIPVPAHTVMFITHSFTKGDQAAENIRYILPNETSSIPLGTPQNEIFYIN